MKKIKTALLSFGMSGRIFHAPFINLHKGFILAGAWERNYKNIHQFYPDVISYSSLEEILNDKTIDLVVVNTPTFTHYEYAKKCLLAGKHIIVEKSFTTTVAEAIDLKEIAAKQHKKLVVFQNRRWDSDFKTVKKIINENLLGELIEAEFHFDRYKPALSPKQHKETKNSGAGLLMDLGPHLIDQALCLFGKPVAVFADIRITRALSKVDDNFDIILYYPLLRVRLKSSYFVREPIPAYVLHGRKGSFLKSRGDTQEAFLAANKKPDDPGYGIEKMNDQGLLHTEKEGVNLIEKIKTLTGNYMDFYTLIYDSIIENKKEPVTANDGIQVMYILEACIKSNAEKKIVFF